MTRDAGATGEITDLDEIDEIDVYGTVLDGGVVLVGKAARQVNGSWIAFARHPGCKSLIIVELGRLTLSKT